MFNKNKQKGYVALVSVLIVSALSLAVSIGVSMRSISGAHMGLSYKRSHQAHILATSCVYEALTALERDLEYAGNEDIIIEDKTCHVYTIEGEGNEDRVVKIEASVDGFVKKIRVEVLRISPTMQIASWKHVVDF